jgi:hypothetical protein
MGHETDYKLLIAKLAFSVVAYSRVDLCCTQIQMFRRNMRSSPSWFKLSVCAGGLCEQRLANQKSRNEKEIVSPNMESHVGNWRRDPGHFPNPTQTTSRLLYLILSLKKKAVCFSETVPYTDMSTQRYI